VRTIPGPLQDHLDLAATTTARLLKVMLRDGRVFGLSSLDRDVTYDDGRGEITYVATNGFDSTTLSSDLGYTVANAEGYALISNDVEGIEIADIEAGVLDDAQWVAYLVNFQDAVAGGALTPERHVVLDAGDVGEVKVKYGLVWMPELLSYAMRLKQPVGGVWSRTCRAIFGTPAQSQTGCGIPLTPLWANGAVAAVGGETNRQFTASLPYTTDSPAPSMVPGRVQFLTGDNAGREFATEEVDGLDVTLSELTSYPIQIGDTYRWRPDCRKRYLEDCIGTYDNGINFKGEPLIPVGDAGSVQAPGAQLGDGWKFNGRNDQGGG
jgi:uncharacterized phage protein (TIGR02218 family)